MDNLFYRKEKQRFDGRGVIRKLLRNKRSLAGLALAVFVSGYVLFGSHGIVQRMKLQQQKTELEEEFHRAEAETRRLQAESKGLDGDKKAIEKVAREKYGMIREGETVYRMKRKK